MRPAAPQEKQLSNLDYVEADVERKALASLTARLALRAIELVRLTGGGYLALSRGAYTALDDPHAVEKFVRRVGA